MPEVKKKKKKKLLTDCEININSVYKNIIRGVLKNSATLFQFAKYLKFS